MHDDVELGPEKVRAPNAQRRLGRAAPWLAIAVVVLPPLIWVLAAVRAADAFHDSLFPGQQYETCPSELEDDLATFDEQLDDLPRTGELAPVADAFRETFGQEHWSYWIEGIQVTRDDLLLGRTDDDGSWEALTGPDDQVARVDGSRFWLRSCPMIRFPDVGLVDGEDAWCIRTERNETRVETSWSKLSCDSGFTLSAATVDGQLTAWTVTTPPSDYGSGTKSTYIVESPPELSWPSPVWIVPGLISDRMSPD